MAAVYIVLTVIGLCIPRNDGSVSEDRVESTAHLMADRVIKSSLLYPDGAEVSSRGLTTERRIEGGRTQLVVRGAGLARNGFGVPRRFDWAVVFNEKAGRYHACGVQASGRVLWSK